MSADICAHCREPINGDTGACGCSLAPKKNQLAAQLAELDRQLRKLSVELWAEHPNTRTTRRTKAAIMTRLDALPAGSHFRLPCTGLCGRLIQADETGATVEVQRARPEKTITTRWGVSKTIPAGIKWEPSWWSCGTMVEPETPAIAEHIPSPDLSPQMELI